MKTKSRPQVLYSEKLEEFISKKFSGHVLHAICTAGEGEFLYDNRPCKFSANNILVLAHPDKISNYVHSADMHMEIIDARLVDIISNMPPNHYGVGGSAWWYMDPIIPVSEERALLFVEDIQNIRRRVLHDNHSFHTQLINSLFQVLQYDMFDAHVCQSSVQMKKDRANILVHSLIEILGTDLLRTHREVSYYAEKLHVSPTYLSDAVRSITGHTAMELITQRTTQLIIEYLKNPRLSFTQIADMMSFSSLNYFTRYVRKNLGKSPSELRSTFSALTLPDSSNSC